MTESIILNSPLLLALYGLALAILVFDRRRPTGTLLPVLSAFLVIGATALSLLWGASLPEGAGAVFVFLLVMLAGPDRRET